MFHDFFSRTCPDDFLSSLATFSTSLVQAFLYSARKLSSGCSSKSQVVVDLRHSGDPILSEWLNIDRARASSVLPGNYISLTRGVLGAPTAIEAPLYGAFSMLLVFARERDHSQGVFQFGECSY